MQQYCFFIHFSKRPYKEARLAQVVRARSRCENCARCIRTKLTYNVPVLIGQQFMLGNYSFVIKALDPKNNTVKEGFKFAEPITITMFYDVDNLVKANNKHVNNELTKEDIDPVLYLWDPKNETW